MQEGPEERFSSRAVTVIITLECWLMSGTLGHFVVASR